MKVPILRHGGILLTSFQDDMTDRDALNLQADLLEMIKQTGDTAVLMDVTSLQMIDSYQANMISETGAMARLLGCEVVLSGVQPKVALTLVELGDVISGIRTVLNIGEGLTLLQDSISRPSEDETAEEDSVNENSEGKERASSDELILETSANEEVSNGP
ncbi:MAG: STAS domain-containing protein [Rhodospirillaceae bacterium]|jgi:rsbT antagonist protein RsbS|nr:STAS domain-containing protein [Rhodospirillales bacterium]MBT3907486.1 STAS domain-containing protein [Rhodospirillaceae bacterium]MBT4701222.1 STAS domain-containing protein [Rhodospirillaceae bacterium]MBT5035551.1 STAS domain-containing protein [Rhodospirillaceae bacterium]MBT6219086.1 STAS domain-containing protein [Rhodospirillaceae bacterium]